MFVSLTYRYKFKFTWKMIKAPTFSRLLLAETKYGATLCGNWKYEFLFDSYILHGIDDRFPTGPVGLQQNCIHELMFIFNLTIFQERKYASCVWFFSNSIPCTLLSDL